MSKKPDDAHRIAGLASILQSGNKEKEPPPSPALPAPPPAAASEALPRPSKNGRVGKYRDPSYHHYGVYLRKDTHKQVKRRLEDLESGQDVSELIQTLLLEWLASSKITE